jgi:hypothetical protein
MKSKDRLTGRPIGLFRLDPEESGNWVAKNYWIYTDIARTVAIEEMKAGARPLPNDICWRNMDSGDYCTSKIRPENTRAQLWACGRHMARYQEEVERHERIAEDNRKRRLQEEMVQWELEEYETAYDRLVELGWQEFLKERPNKPRWGGTMVRGKVLEIDLKEFLSLVDPEQEDYDDDIDTENFSTVEEDFFATGDM